MDIKNIKIDVNQVKAELCKRSFYYFLQEFWDVIIPEKPVYNWHIKYLCDHLQEQAQLIKERKPKRYDTVINIPPGTTKSTICTVMFPAWCWCVDPTFRIITGSYSASLATDHAVKSRDIVKSEKYQLYFPEVQIKKDQDNKTQYKTTKGGERYATSVGGTITGIHAHLIIIDDPLNPKQADSDVERETANNWMDVTLSTRKVDKEMTPTILVMQRLHEEDCTGNWLKKRKDAIHHICLPAKISNDVNPYNAREYYVDGLLDPIRLSEKALSELKTILGSYGYAGQIQQIPAPEDGGVWQKWLKPIKRNELPQLIDIGSDWDLAYTKEDKNSASAFVTSGKYQNDMYITNLGFKWLEFPDLIEYMKSQTPTHYIEAKASGKSSKQTLSKMNINAVEVKVDGGDKVGRTKLATPFAEAGRIFIAEDLIDKLYNDDQQGILKFPNNSHNDLNDALVQAITRHFIKKQTKTGKIRKG